MRDKYKILHVADEASDAELVAIELRKNNICFEHLVVNCEKDYLQALDQFAPDIILCEHSLKFFNSVEAIHIINARQLYVPVILVTAAANEDVAIKLVMEGAHDYLLKGRLKRLPAALKNAIENSRLKNERIQIADKAHKKEILCNKLSLATKFAGKACGNIV
jgi:DNA-binding NtrC family response regulator